jgi:ligand-binding SRPBCC domain-containing protein
MNKQHLRKNFMIPEDDGKIIDEIKTQLEKDTGIARLTYSQVILYLISFYQRNKDKQ